MQVDERTLNGGRRVRRRLMPLALLLIAAAPADRAAIAVFGDWGAFREDRPARCFALAEPLPGTLGYGHANVAVTSWPARRIRAQLSVRLSRGHRAGARTTLTIGDSGFQLVSDGATVWASDRRQDAAIVAAMRSGSSMSVATVSPEGRAYADVYRLRGAASAIDAAMLACPMR